MRRQEGLAVTLIPGGLLTVSLLVFVVCLFVMERGDLVSPTPALQHRLSMTKKTERKKLRRHLNLKSNILPVGFYVVLLLFNRLPHLLLEKQH